MFGLYRVTWILATRCSATTISLTINPPVSRKTEKSTTLGYFVTCRSSLDTWLRPDFSTMSPGDSGNSSGIAQTLGNECSCLAVAGVLPSHLRTICRRLWGEPVNLREQHDAMEFFNSLVDSLDEALKALGHPAMLSKVLGGSFADQKICQGCPHR